jgi:hypothetical protein
MYTPRHPSTQTSPALSHLPIERASSPSSSKNTSTPPSLTRPLCTGIYSSVTSVCPLALPPPSSPSVAELRKAADAPSGSTPRARRVATLGGGSRFSVPTEGAPSRGEATRRRASSVRGVGAAMAVNVVGVERPEGRRGVNGSVGSVARSVCGIGGATGTWARWRAKCTGRAGTNGEDSSRVKVTAKGRSTCAVLGAWASSSHENEASGGAGVEDEGMPNADLMAGEPGRLGGPGLSVRLGPIGELGEDMEGRCCRCKGSAGAGAATLGGKDFGGTGGG